jgi:voltage-gated potassium channel
VQLVERVVSPEECGCPISELKSGGQGLRVYRKGRAIGFWEDECQALQPGDVVVEIVPTAPNDAAPSS